MLRLRNDEWLEVGEDIDGFEWLAAQTYERFQVRPGWRESLHGQPRWIALWGIALPPDRLCVSCGYDLTGNRSGRCPECGITCRWPHSTADIDADGE
ncbi:MAG: hypothetical protein HZB38_07465 [Planctomycetes bacterium]|nr:hypothetical protein [Planctomycetota bacterium]